MRLLRLALALASAAGIHALGTRLAPAFPQAVDLFLLVAVLPALDGRYPWAIAGGTAAGLAADALSGAPFGLHGFADTITAYATAFAAQRLVVERASGVWLVCALATAAQQALLVGLGLVILPRPVFPSWIWVLIKAVANGSVGALLWTAGGRLAARLEGWRHSRTARLRL